MRTCLALFAGVIIFSASAQAQSQDAASYVFSGGYPTEAASARARDDTDYSRALVAYRFWYPAVSAEGIFNGNRAAGNEDNKGMAAMAAGPRQIGFTLNSDTPYGAATLDLSSGPMVIELPPGPYIGLADDHYQGWILDMGLPGPDAGKGGKHLVLPPGYTGEVPPGYFVGRASSNKVLVAVRALPVNANVQGAMDALKAIKVYPLANAADPPPFTVKDTTALSIDSTCLKWEDNIAFWQKLHDIIDAEPLVDKFMPMYGLLAALGIEKGKPFVPDERMKAILERAAKAGRDQMLVAAFASARPDRFAWPDRKWEWAGLVPGSAQFETPAGIDLEARDRWFAQAIVTSPAMFRRTAGAGSLYWLGARDSSGAFLRGEKSYKLTIPQPVPDKLFWSVTIYDAQTRSEVQTDQDKAALRSMFELKDVSKSAPTELYFGPNAPAGQEGRWIKTVPGRGWFAYIRIYGPEEAAFNGSWKPNDIVEVQ
jgi:hypothetical protein